MDTMTAMKASGIRRMIWREKKAIVCRGVANHVHDGKRA